VAQPRRHDEESDPGERVAKPAADDGALVHFDRFRHLASAIMIKSGAICSNASEFGIGSGGRAVE
jgi:hypothetical protein